MKKFTRYLRPVVAAVGIGIGLFIEHFVKKDPVSPFFLVVIAVVLLLVVLFALKLEQNKRNLHLSVVSDVVLLGLFIFDGFVTERFGWIAISFWFSLLLLDSYRLLTFKKGR